MASKTQFICKRTCVDARGRVWKAGAKASEAELVARFHRIPEFFMSPEAIVEEAEKVLDNLPPIVTPKGLDELETMAQMKKFLMGRNVYVRPGIKKAELEKLLKAEEAKIREEADRAALGI